MWARNAVLRSSISGLTFRAVGFLDLAEQLLDLAVVVLENLRDVHVRFLSSCHASYPAAVPEQPRITPRVRMRRRDRLRFRRPRSLKRVGEPRLDPLHTFRGTCRLPHSRTADGRTRVRALTIGRASGHTPASSSAVVPESAVSSPVGSRKTSSMPTRDRMHAPKITSDRISSREFGKDVSVRRSLGILLFLATLLAGCTVAPVPTAPEPAPPNSSSPAHFPAAIPPAPTSPAPTSTGSTRPAGPIVGVNNHALWSDRTDGERIAVLDKLAAAGVRSIRIDVGWRALQESGPGALARGTCNEWTSSWIRRERCGMDVLAMVWSTPALGKWRTRENVPPTDVATYASVMKALAAHFQGRVTAWEVWNEPDLAHFFNGSAAQYTALLRAAYPAIKRGDPKALVLNAGPTYNSVDWVRRLYANGARGSFDVLATHGYQAPADAPPEFDDGSQWVIARIADVRAVMIENGDGAVPIWFTEFGWSSHANDANTLSWSRGVSPRQQADYLVRMLDLVGKQYPYVTRVYWYNERNRTDADPHNNNFGLLGSDLSEKPALAALRSWLGFG